MRLFLTAAMAGLMLTAPATASAAKLAGPELVEIADISVSLNGLVCDFCSIALNKTFKKRDDILATYVDLDTKILSLSLKEGASLSNEDIMKLVEKAGYTTTKIARKDGSVFVPPAK